MATIVLGTVGRLVGGPIGGIIGATLGGVIDSSLFATTPRGGRMSNLAVQSAAYGEPIAVITGRMRAAGNLLWTGGIIESTSGGGKGRPGGYSYSASFAVALTGRVIADVGRIWADGKLIRDENGRFLSPVTMRLHRGDELQVPDPLIAAFEGLSGAPAYRGIAYAVFEDLPLADFGNRIPNLTFEIVADVGENHDAGTAIAALAAADGRPCATVSGAFPAIAGHFAGRSGSIAEALGPLLEITGAAVVSTGGLLVHGAGGSVMTVPAQDSHARLPGQAPQRARRKLLGGESRIGAVELNFYDVARDYQPGLQRARRDAGGAVDQRAVACSMTAAGAKTLAASLLARREAARWQTSIRLPWRYLGLGPGDRLGLDGEPGVWRVRQSRFESFIVHLDLERVDAGGVRAVASDPGRAASFADQAVGETSLQVLDLPAFPGDVPAGPRLWLAAAGRSEGWRRAAIDVSGDQGDSYVRAGTASAATPMGLAGTVLPPGPADCWDRHSAVEIAMLSEAMWLESRPALSVLSGANLALIGNEIVQFSEAEAIAVGRFRLSGLLRGRLGSEAAIVGHGADERFVLLDRTTMLPFDPPPDALQRAFRFRAAGAGDADAPALEVVARGAALRPLAPAHFRLAVSGGDVVAHWVRRSRLGFGWVDFVDAPLGEASEAYRLDIWLDGRPVRSLTLSSASHVYTSADRTADGGGTVVSMAVAQMSAAVGPGETTTGTVQVHF